MAEVIKRKRLNIKQSDKLSFARFNLTLNESRFVALLMAQIKLEDDDFIEYEITFKDLEALTGAKQDVSKAKKFTETLVKKVVTVERENGDFTMFNWFHHITYVQGEGKFLAQFHDYMKPLLLLFGQRFGKSSLLYISRFKGQYTSRFYYMFCSTKASFKNTLDVEIEELYEMLQLPKSLRVYADFKKRVLNPVLDEINEITDLNVKCLEARKIRKKIISVRFEIYNKDKNLLDFIRS